MNKKENRKKWIAALRSGLFEQTHDYLAADSGYCCLGVLCEVAMANGVPVLKDQQPNQLTTYDGQNTHPSQQVMDWVGLRQRAGGYVTETGAQQYLTVLNDNGKTFAEIADVIESEPKGLFDAD